MREWLMRLGAILLISGVAFGRTAEEPRLLSRVTPLPVAPDPAFKFRKTKIYYLSEHPATEKQKGGKGKGAAGKQQGSAGAATAHSKSTSVVQDASINFERQYRLFG